MDAPLVIQIPLLLLISTGVALFARSLNRGFWMWFFGSMIVTPILPFLYLLFAGQKKSRKSGSSPNPKTPPEPETP